MIKARRLLRQRAILVPLGALVLLLVADRVAADASCTGFDWSTWYSESQTLVIQERVFEDYGSPGPGDDFNVITVTATRGPISGGSCALRANVHSDTTDLQSIRLLQANDTNGSGTIDAGEWSVLGTANAVSDGSGGSTATVFVLAADPTKDAHRIEHTYTWGTTDVTIQDCALN